MAIPEASAVVTEKSYTFLLWAVNAVEKAPRSLRYSLGERVIEASLDVVEGVVDAAYTRERTQALRRVQLRIERLRFLVRAMSDLKAIGFSQYEHAARSLDEIGRLVGGWRKADAKATQPPVRGDRGVPGVAQSSAQGD